MQRILSFFSLLGLICCYSIVVSAAEDKFPGRAKFPDVAVIELKDLKKQKDTVVIIDARSEYEYNTLRVKGAINIPLSSKSFSKDLRKLRETTDKPFVFYCNGHTCFKSYKAVQKATHNKIEGCYSFDAGVFDWARAYPDNAVLLGQSPVNPKDLISKKEFKKRLINPSEFERKVDDASIVLDVRDRQQREAIGFFPGHEYWVSLDNKGILSRYFEKAKREGKTLLIYDAVGKQVRWLQYSIEEAGLKNYFFMKDGAKGYYDMLAKQYFK